MLITKIILVTINLGNSSRSRSSNTPVPNEFARMFLTKHEDHRRHLATSQQQLKDLSLRQHIATSFDQRPVWVCLMLWWMRGVRGA